MIPIWERQRGAGARPPPWVMGRMDSVRGSCLKEEAPSQRLQPGKGMCSGSDRQEPGSGSRTQLKRRPKPQEEVCGSLRSDTGRRRVFSLPRSHEHLTIHQEGSKQEPTRVSCSHLKYTPPHYLQPTWEQNPAPLLGKRLQ